jgi:hypothetical protein
MLGSCTWLPDGLISNQEPKFGEILEGLAMEEIGIHILVALGLFYGLLLYVMDLWYSSW